MRACQPKVSSVRPFTPSFYSFSFETTKDTAGCRAFHRNYIVGGAFFHCAFLSVSSSLIYSFAIILPKMSFRS